MSNNLEKLRQLFSEKVESVNDYTDDSVPVGAIESAVEKIADIYRGLPNADVPNHLAETLQEMIDYCDGYDLWNTNSYFKEGNMTFHRVYDGIKDASDARPLTERRDINANICCRLTELQDSAIYPDWAEFSEAHCRKKMIALRGGARLPFFIPAKIWNAITWSFSKLKPFETDFKCDELFAAPYHKYAYGKSIGCVDPVLTMDIAMQVFDGIYPVSGFYKHPDQIGGWLSDFLEFLLNSPKGFEIEYWSELDQFPFEHFAWKYDGGGDWDEHLDTHLRLRILTYLRKHLHKVPPLPVKGRAPIDVVYEVHGYC